MNLATLTLRRSGTFTQLVEGTHHCGPVGALVDYVGERPADAHDFLAATIKGRTVKVTGKGIPVQYKLVVACGPTLDHRGFLFDQTMVQAWFERQGLTPSALSCEALVIKLANMLQEKIQRDAPHCDVRGVTLELSPAPFAASVSAHYSGRP